MGAKQESKDRLRVYLLPQDKKWVRVLEASAAVFCFASAVVALYLVNTQPGGRLPAVSNLVVWTYLITSLPLALLLYSKSGLRKIERLVLVFFMLASSMSFAAGGNSGIHRNIVVEALGLLKNTSERHRPADSMP